MSLIVDSNLQFNRKKVVETFDAVKKVSIPKVKELEHRSSTFISTFRKVFNDEMKKSQQN
jgi:hypothetical protein